MSSGEEAGSKLRAIMPRDILSPFALAAVTTERWSPKGGIGLSVLVDWSRFHDSGAWERPSHCYYSAEIEARGRQNRLHWYCYSLKLHVDVYLWLNEYVARMSRRSVFLFCEALPQRDPCQHTKQRPDCDTLKRCFCTVTQSGRTLPTYVWVLARQSTGGTQQSHIMLCPGKKRIADRVEAILLVLKYLSKECWLDIRVCAYLFLEGDSWRC